MMEPIILNNKWIKAARLVASAVLQRDIRSEEHTELIDSFIEKLGDSHD